MRSVERLIRQLKNARITVVNDEQKTALRKVLDHHALKDTPKAVQAAFVRMKKLTAEEAELKRVIEGAGYRTYQSGNAVYRNNAESEKGVIRTRAEGRIKRIEALCAEALIDTIGTTPEQSKDALVTFRAAILKV